MDDVRAGRPHLLDSRWGKTNTVVRREELHMRQKSGFDPGHCLATNPLVSTLMARPCRCRPSCVVTPSSSPSFAGRPQRGQMGLWLERIADATHNIRLRHLRPRPDLVEARRPRSGTGQNDQAQRALGLREEAGEGEARGPTSRQLDSPQRRESGCTRLPYWPRPPREQDALRTPRPPRRGAATAYHMRCSPRCGRPVPSTGIRA
jgi:hypothetical protein